MDCKEYRAGLTEPCFLNPATDSLDWGRFYDLMLSEPGSTSSNDSLPPPQPMQPFSEEPCETRSTVGKRV
jgi:hypothetical protein